MVANISGTLNGYSVNEQYKLLFGTSFKRTYPYSYNNSSSSNINTPDSSFFTTQFWNAQNLIGIYQGIGSWISTTLNPVTYDVTQQSIALTYYNQNQVNVSTLINSTLGGLLYITLFVCIVSIIYDYRSSLSTKLHFNINNVDK